MISTFDTNRDLFPGRASLVAVMDIMALLIVVDRILTASHCVVHDARSEKTADHHFRERRVVS